MRRKRILSVSHVPFLLSTRDKILSNSGYEVVSVLGNAVDHCKRGGFDLLLIGHSIPDAEVDAMIAAWRGNSDAPIVVILRRCDPLPAGTEHVVDCLEPAQLVEIVAQLLRVDRPLEVPESVVPADADSFRSARHGPQAPVITQPHK